MTRPFIRRTVLAALAALTFTAPPLRAEQADVLAIGGSVTEIAVALGQGHRLKARDSTSTYPPAIAALPDVGYMRALSPEGVLSVDPALILAEEGAGPPETLEVIRAAGVDFVAVPNTPTAEGILNKIRVIGNALDVPDAAGKLAAEVKAALAQAMAEAARPRGDTKRVLFVLSTQGGRINVAGTDTAADALIRMAGGQNAVSGFSGYRQISEEAVGQAAPDVILMMDRGGDHGPGDDELFALPAIRLTPAARDRAAIGWTGC